MAAPHIPPYQMVIGGKIQQFSYNEGPDYEHHEYPKWKYHSSGESVLVHTENEEIELGDDWQDRPVQRTSVPVAGNRLGQRAAPRPEDAPQISETELEEFRKFQAWKAAQSAAGADKASDVKLTPDEEKKVLLELAAERGINVDKRWSVERIKSTLDQAEAA